MVSLAAQYGTVVDSLRNVVVFSRSSLLFIIICIFYSWRKKDRVQLIPKNLHIYHHVVGKMPKVAYLRGV